MLYRLRPERRVEWCDLPITFADVDELEGSPVDLDRLDWEPASRRFDDDTLRVAFRVGRKSAVGLIVAGTDLVPLDHPRRIREAHAEAVAYRPQYRQTLERMEEVMPGTLQAEDASNAAVDESIRASLAEADEGARALLAREPSGELVAHWRAAGGMVPDPV